jgi:vacuole morphology and inheritance protein 14
VVKHDLQLLAQISASSEESYFTSFMVNVLELFSTDRRLLETRGSLIIRQLCLHLNAERIFRTIADILEKDDVSGGHPLVEKASRLIADRRRTWSLPV